MSADVLAIGPHPDDVEIFFGGTVARLVEDGRQVAIVDLTRGELGTRGTPEERAVEAAEAAKILGVTTRENLDLGDGALGTDPDQRLAIAAAIRRHRPALVLTLPRQSRHPDHARTAELVAEASFLAGLAKLELDGEPHRPDRVIHALEMIPLTPSFVVDVTAQWERKMAAIRAYDTQVDATDGPTTRISRPEYLEELEARARWFGSQVGVRYAEAFVTDLPPRLDDLVGSLTGVEPV